MSYCYPENLKPDRDRQSQEPRPEERNRRRALTGCSFPRFPQLPRASQNLRFRASIFSYNVGLRWQWRRFRLSSEQSRLNYHIIWLIIWPNLYMFVYMHNSILLPFCFARFDFSFIDQQKSSFLSLENHSILSTIWVI